MDLQRVWWWGVRLNPIPPHLLGTLLSVIAGLRPPMGKMGSQAFRILAQPACLTGEKPESQGHS